MKKASEMSSKYWLEYLPTTCPVSPIQLSSAVKLVLEVVVIAVVVVETRTLITGEKPCSVVNPVDMIVMTMVILMIMLIVKTMMIVMSIELYNSLH